MAEKVNSELISEIKKKMPNESFLYDLADFYRIFGDSTRIKILYALYEGEMCVLDIAKVLHMTQSAISHQLRILKDAKLVKFRRDGKTVYYSLDDDHIVKILELGTQHLEEE
ncbi:MAG: helix-turn-helix transcriptional regulator [Erysipelotrichales bacterium]|nr:helix-turn-helix transcriptional regulator [Erysipelotrichales bacterium]